MIRNVGNHDVATIFHEILMYTDIVYVLELFSPEQHWLEESKTIRHLHLCQLIPSRRSCQILEDNQSCNDAYVAQTVGFMSFRESTLALTPDKTRRGRNAARQSTQNSSRSYNFGIEN